LGVVLGLALAGVALGVGIGLIATNHREPTAGRAVPVPIAAPDTVAAQQAEAPLRLGPVAAPPPSPRPEPEAAPTMPGLPAVPVPAVPLPGAPAAEPAPRAPPASVGGPVICIDPGHPSDQSAGTQARSGRTEIEVNWWIGEKLEAELRARGYQVVMTKHSRGEMVTNRRRAEIANAAHARLLLRLHCDASSGTGYALYYPREAGHKDGHTGPSAQVREASAAAAEALHDGMKWRLAGALRDGGVLTDLQTGIGGKQGALTGSIFSEVPVVTVEMLVLTNDRDAEWVEHEGNQRLLAAALADGVERCVPPGVARRN
jgi:N-acetylmuramoyl-L-alanine amidase